MRTLSRFFGSCKEEANPVSSVPQIETIGLAVGYGKRAVLDDLNISVGIGELVALVGPNGVGKTTIISTLSGIIPPLAGVVRWNGDVFDGPLHIRARAGLSLVPEERAIFRQLRTQDNLRVAKVEKEICFALFPELRRLSNVRAGDLSGGEQQMLMLALALARRPKAILVDELSLGLAPLLTRRLLETLRRVAEEQSVAVLFVEQQTSLALEFADRIFILGMQGIRWSGSRDEALFIKNEIAEFYLGGETVGDVSSASSPNL